MINLIDIAPAFSFVIENGLVTSTIIYAPQEFGNANLVMTGKPFSLRFTRDRGQVFVDVGNDVAGWYKLEYILEFTDRSITQEQLDEPPNVILLAKFLQEHWDKVVHLFNDQQKMLQLQTFTKQKMAGILGKIFRNF